MYYYCLVQQIIFLSITIRKVFKNLKTRFLYFNSIKVLIVSIINMPKKQIVNDKKSI